MEDTLYPEWGAGQWAVFISFFAVLIGLFAIAVYIALHNKKEDYTHND